MPSKQQKLNALATQLPSQSKGTVAFEQSQSFTPEAPDIIQEQSERTLMQAAAEKTWLGYSAAHQWEAAQGEIDDDFAVSPEELQVYKDKGYSETELSFLGASHSADNLAARLKRIDDDREIDRQLSDAGGFGIAAQLGTGFVDPALLPAMLISGGAVAASKLNTAKAVAVSAVEGAAVNGALEYYMAKGDTQRDTSDVIVAIASGAALSGLITTGARSYQGFRDAQADARVIDTDNSDAISGVVAGREYSKADEALSQGMTDATQRRRYLSEKEVLDELESELIAKKTGEVLSAKKVKKLKQEFRAYRKAKKEQMGKIAASNMRPSAKKKQIQQLQDAVDRREAVLNNQLYDNAKLAEVRSQLDAIQQGAIPDSLRARYDEMMAEIGESDLKVNTSGIDADVKATKDAEMAKMPEPEQPAGQDVGAAATDPLTLKYEMYGNLLPELDEGSVTEAIEDSESFGESIPRVSRLATGAPITRSMSSDIDRSMLSGIRGIGAKLFPNGVRTIKGHQSATELANSIFHRGMQQVNEYNVAKENWIREQGISWMDWSKQAEASRQFDKEVAVAQITGQGHPAILEGAKLKAEINKLALESNKAYKVHGFENVSHTDDYISVVYDYDNMTELVKSGVKAEQLADVIAKGYMTGKIKLEEQYAITLAKAQIERAASTAAGVNKAYRFGVTEADFKHVETELLKQGIDADSVRDLRESIFTDELKQNRSPRAMHSLKPNLLASSGNIKMIDVIDTSIDRNIKYLRESSANAGLYSVGIQGRKQLQQIMDEMDKRSQNELLAVINNYGADSKAGKKAAEELELIKNGHYRERIEGGVSLMYGEPIGTGSDVAGDMLRTFRKGTSMLRLRATGLTTLPEFAYGIARTGGLRMLKAATGTRFFDLRKGSVAKDEFMQEFSRAFGATGHQEYLFGRNAYNGSDFDDVTKTKLGIAMDKMLDKGMNLTMTANLFRTIQHGGEETVARAVVDGIREAGKSGEINKAVRSLVEVGGLSEQEAMDIAKELGKHNDIFDGVRMLDPTVQARLSSAVQSHISASFMRVRVGEGAFFTHQEIGKTVSHLLNFAIASYEKQLVRGITQEKALLTAAMTMQFGIGALAHTAYVYQKAAAMDGKDRASYLDNKLSDEGLFWGMLNKVGVFAYPMTVLQMLSSFGLLPDAITGSPTKAGVSGFGGVPVVGMASDVVRGGRAAVGQIKDATFNEMNTDDEEAARAMRKLLPVVDTPLWNLTAGQVLAED